MSALSPDPDTRPPRKRHRKVTVISLSVGGGFVILLVVILVLALVTFSRRVPEFPSLAATPDPGLHGTVAYFADESACVRIVAAAGQPSRTVLCLPDQDPAQAEKLGKLVGPQLVWRADGRLEVTMFRLTDPPGPSFNPGWQKVVDVRTGAVEEVSAADAPAEPNRTTQPTVRPNGDRVSVVSTDDGKATVTLHESAGGPRTLLSVQGPGEYTYEISAAFWAPHWQWIAADDGRILIITPGRPAVTRILTAETTRGGYGGYARFAVTAADLLTTTS